MNDAHSTSAPSTATAIFAGTLLPGFVGAIAGIVYAFSTWAEVDTPLQIFGGGLMGGVPAMLLGGMLAWHGAALAAGVHAEGAPIWGLFPGFVIGASIMPVLTFVLAIPASEAVGGGLFGLILGPLVGIAGWELGYWGTKLLG